MKKSEKLKAKIAEAKQRYGEAEVVEKLRLCDDDLKALDKIASGKPFRHAAAVLRAIEMKLEYTQPKPKQKVEVGGEGGGPLQVAINIVRTVQATPPTVRRIVDVTPSKQLSEGEHED